MLLIPVGTTTCILTVLKGKVGGTE